MRGSAERCYSGECGDCLIEIEAVLSELPGGQPSYEVYEMHKSITRTSYEDDYSAYFPSPTISHPKPKPKKGKKKP